MTNSSPSLAFRTQTAADLLLLASALTASAQTIQTLYSLPNINVADEPVAPPQTVGGTWTMTAIYTFDDNDATGSTPYAAPVYLGHALFGTKSSGGTSGSGIIYSLKQVDGVWTYTVLHSFTGSDGATPGAALIGDRFGNLYGSTIAGGSAGQGVAFEISTEQPRKAATPFAAMAPGTPGTGAERFSGSALRLSASASGTKRSCTVSPATPTGRMAEYPSVPCPSISTVSSTALRDVGEAKTRA